MKVIFLLFTFISCTYSYNFLVFCPLFGHSHTTFFGKVADTLTDAGHNVTFFTPTIIKRFSKINYVKSTKHVVHLEPSEKLAWYGDKFDSDDVSKFWKRDSVLSEMLPMIDSFNGMFFEQASVLQENLELLDNLKAMKFDVMIFESFVFPAYHVLDYLQVKAFIPSTSTVFDDSLLHGIGEPLMPSTVPGPMLAFSEQMSLLERIINTITPLLFELIVPKREFKSFRPPHALIDIPSLDSLSSFIFTNSNPYIDYPRPTNEKNVQIGGISVDIEQLKSQKVNEEWDGILNLRSKTVLVSFGSIMLSRDMGMKNKIALASTMKNFPDVTFIWKYESNDTDSFAEGIGNIHFSEWVPQTALLGDQRLSAFFTHAGLGSINEVSYLGKPAILCPLFADQMRNAKMLARHNGSVEISKYHLSDSEKLTDAFRKILYDESYGKAAENLALQLQHQPVKPKELLVRHAEFAAQFGRLPSLDPYSRQMSFIEYFLIDVVLVAVSLLLLISFVFLKTLKWLVKRLPFTFSSVKQKLN